MVPYKLSLHYYLLGHLVLALVCSGMLLSFFFRAIVDGLTQQIEQPFLKLSSSASGKDPKRKGCWKSQRVQHFPNGGHALLGKSKGTEFALWIFSERTTNVFYFPFGKYEKCLKGWRTHMTIFPNHHFLLQRERHSCLGKSAPLNQYLHS